MINKNVDICLAQIPAFKNIFDLWLVESKDVDSEDMRHQLYLNKT